MIRQADDHEREWEICVQNKQKSNDDDIVCLFTFVVVFFVNLSRAQVECLAKIEETLCHQAPRITKQGLPIMPNVKRMQTSASERVTRLMGFFNVSGAQC